jgi:glycosyltransferase involved in cell wall biosynthesis
MTTPHVSVVIPTFQRSSLLVAALESVLRQDMPDLDVVVVEDGESADIRLAAKHVRDPRVRFLALPHHSGNPGYVRNQALAVIDSPWVAFLDSDDRWLDRHLTSGISWLEASGASFLAQSSVTIETKVTPLCRDPEPIPVTTQDLLDRNSIRTSGVICRRDLLAEAGWFPEKPGVYEDWGLWLRVSRCADLYQTPIPTIEYRQQPDSQSHALDPTLARYQTLLDFLEWLTAHG